jgi:hypothetical protein
MTEIAEIVQITHVVGNNNTVYYLLNCWK